MIDGPSAAFQLMINEELLTQTKKVNAETFRDALPSKVYQVLERKNSVCARSGFKLIMGVNLLASYTAVLWISALYNLRQLTSLPKLSADSNIQDLWYYLDNIAGIAKGVAPTLLVGRAVAGHTRPKDDCDGSPVSSLHFQPPSGPGPTSSQPEESTVQSAVLAMDIEAQPEHG
ncbi:uncharacterized protein ARMOST_16402 [Armillaria ostoyae]|uniref:Uncharacterized protein n=1 Tax=Armillaria ostoyae TaxID=47428 RepID=A0A284RW27_ARMOS|nr:uncharacterized protein ARMOST_16402 [Armillaria ostoyae]